MHAGNVQEVNKGRRKSLQGTLRSLVSVQNAAGCRPLQFFGPGMLAVLPAGGTDGEQRSTANELLQSSPSQDRLQGGPGLFGSLLVRLQASVTAVFSPIAPAGKTD